MCSVATTIPFRLKSERKRLGWSLNELASRSGVSRAMISKIERGVSTPTAALLARLADALGVTMSGLMFDKPERSASVSRLADQGLWTDPDSGYTRRLVSSAATPGDAEIVAVELPATARAGFPAHGNVRIDGQVLLQEGRLEIATAAELLRLNPGDCARIAIHLAHELHNPGPAVARYIVVLRQIL